ncbi:GNAT family N-acetyltransferase [Streptomyces lunaelactis]|uniref:GNAT family N-acetyltransferase n=1 Tax=Streptomyces lunaelactis TaxID=1535768 RepID=UPI0015852308|nr:GNAT family N-acetyltransferase [Streptomyces lunaelactis]NUK38343.1 GNAT family N-acetyltransferase [Streptomyces lunaelactis]NUK45364.1 GNAT family N-acetyltransferase [Streptomyces lunaelactis]NUK61448.1 GNAT family N-acetyltransferase [Streptomyces lunaelactis]NUK96025.1 GNAT family N-acetyltransferase [Streptomyces lunaelactis]NUL33840.1 GNAT family N-acetyltransferase [Streptomyces lunaelactis]
MANFLETERLSLRPFGEADVDRLLNLDSDPEVMRFINGGRPTTREAVRTEALPRFLHRYPCIGNPALWAAEERTTKEFVGWFELRPLDENSAAVAELGYRLARAAWGRGFATEGSRALIRKGFTEFGVQRVTANTMTVNARSRRVLEKVGLTYVRTFFEEWPETIEGSGLGDVEYALTRADWELKSTG